jgi:hypothetical protein
VHNSTQETLSLAYSISALTYRKHSFSIVASTYCIIKTLLPSNGNVFTEPLPRNGRRSQSHRLATGLYATIFRKTSWTVQCDTHFAISEPQA